MKSKFVRRLSVHLCHPLSLNLLHGFFFKFYFLLPLRHMSGRCFFFFFFFFFRYFSFSLTLDSMGVKTSKRYSSLKSLLDFSTLVLNFIHSGRHKSTAFGFWKFWVYDCSQFFFVFVNMGPFWSKNFKTLLLPQITIKYFETSPDFFFNRPHKSTFWMFKIVSFWFLASFWNSPLYPMRELKTSIISKTRDLVQNGVKFEPQGWVFSVYRVLLTIKLLRSFYGHSVDFRCSTTLCLENGWS